ncbi:MAG: lantibiotic immunity ABC transporter MutE/EpiE family permease subunit [Oscillospiraceae bacterium]
MINYLKAEFLKQKHRFTLKLLWLAPLVAIVLPIILMGGHYFTEGAFNWWYTMILPGALSMMIAFTVSAEKKHNRHGLFAVCVYKKSLWISQMVMITVLLLFINLIFFAFMAVIGAFFGIYVPLVSSLSASLVLFLTLAWQIPVFMFISEVLGSFPSIIISLVSNVGFGIFFAPTKLWYVPFAIPARLMCPIIKVLPNGLPLEAGHILDNSAVVFIGIIITAALYLIFSVTTAAWFSHREVR